MEITPFDLAGSLQAHNQLVQQQRQNDTQNAFAEALPQLQSNPQNALATIGRTGNLDAYSKFSTIINQADEHKRAQIATKTSALAKIALSVQQYPDPVVRKAVAMSQLAQFSQDGVTADDIQRGDFSDNGVKTITGMARTVEQTMAQINTDVDNKRADDKLVYDKEKDARDFKETVRAHNLTDARSREANTNKGYRLMTPEEKQKAGLPGEAAYQINGEGKIDRVAGNNSVRPIPAKALDGIQGNRLALQKIDRAIAALEKNPEALGWGNYAGDSVTQRIPGKAGTGGVSTRAIIADIGSQKLHDRSGANVTVSESPRLLPFIPQVTDTPQTAKKKLQQLRMEYESNLDEAEAFFTPESGYMSVPKPGKPGNSGGKQVNAGVIDFNDLPD